MHLTNEWDLQYTNGEWDLKYTISQQPISGQYPRRDTDVYCNCGIVLFQKLIKQTVYCFIHFAGT